MLFRIILFVILSPSSAPPTHYFSWLSQLLKLEIDDIFGIPRG